MSTAKQKRRYWPSTETQLQNVDYAKAFASYLLTHGMTQQQLDALVQVLTNSHNCYY